MNIDRRGSILILTVWVMSMLAVFAVYIAYIVNQRAVIAGRIEDDENLHFTAGAGVTAAILELKTLKAQPAVTALGPECLNRPDLFRDVTVGNGSFCVSYTVRDPNAGAEETRYGFIDEESKININTAPSVILDRLIQSLLGLDPGQAERLAYAICDYRDVDTVTVTGADEAFFYGSKMKNSNFEILDELMQVPGITPEIFFKLKNYITVYGNGKVNINTASAQTLEILGLDSEVARKVLLFRAGRDGVSPTADDNMVSDISKYYDTISQFEKFSPQEATELEGLLLSGLVSTRSTAVFISSSALLKNKRKSVRIECIYDLAGKIRSWKEIPGSS